MIGENLKKLKGSLKMSQKQLAKEISINRSTLADYETGASEPNIETLKSFSEYFNITLDELINGTPTESSRSSNQGLKILAVTVDSANNENVELIPEQAKAGYLEGFKDPEFIKTLPKFHFPNLPTGTYRAFEIKGDSMPPINDGFIVIGKYAESFNDIVHNRRYVFITANEGVVFKRVKRNAKSRTELTLVSDNLLYPPYSISKAEIL